MKQTSSTHVLENGLREIAGLLQADMALLHLRTTEGFGLAAYGLESVPAVHRLQRPEPGELSALSLRALAREALREREARLRTIVESEP